MPVLALALYEILGVPDGLKVGVLSKTGHDVLSSGPMSEELKFWFNVNWSV